MAQTLPSPLSAFDRPHKLWKDPEALFAYVMGASQLEAEPGEEVERLQLISLFIYSWKPKICLFWDPNIYQCSQLQKSPQPPKNPNRTNIYSPNSKGRKRVQLEPECHLQYLDLLIIWAPQGQALLSGSAFYSTHSLSHRICCYAGCSSSLGTSATKPGPCARPFTRYQVWLPAWDTALVPLDHSLCVLTLNNFFPDEPGRHWSLIS